MDSCSDLTDQQRLVGHRRRRRRWGVAVLLMLALGVLVWVEVDQSLLQASLFVRATRDLSWRPAPGAAPQFWLPQEGPYNARLGYTQLQTTLPRLVAAGFSIAAQSRQSAGFVDLVSRGYHPIYHEKSQAGLTLRDRQGTLLYQARFPERQYAGFAALPPLLVDTLLYVENRGLLDASQPWKNPAVDWPRLLRAMGSQALRQVDWDAPRAGGSTLATQVEKFRHSPGGRTRDAQDKFRQMVSASLRAYQDGEATLPARQRIVTDFLNSVPLGGFPGYGEVNGLGDGLWAWYGRDFAEANRLLADGAAAPALRGEVFREALSLLIAQRRPSALLSPRGQRLDGLTDAYLRLLARDGVIDTALRDAALAARTPLRRTPPAGNPVSFVARKAVNDVRSALVELLDAGDFYSLDHYDLEARSALDGPVQGAVSDFLAGLGAAPTVKCLGLNATRLLIRGDPEAVRYSFTLYESTPGGNLLRVQADNLDQPLDLNAGTKLDLGSSAKLRTLVSYLEAVAELHARFAELSPVTLDAEAAAARPAANLTRWALDYLRHATDRGLPAMLAAAMERRYSASPGEVFFTGGGAHRFNNFRHEDDAMRPTVAEALAQSVNLVFIRLMRDLVHYHAYEAADSPARALAMDDEAARLAFLARFADREGKEFLARFWSRYGKVAADDLLPTLAASVGSQPRRLAAAYLAVAPDTARDFNAFAAFLRGQLAARAGDDAQLRRYYNDYANTAFSLADWGFLARSHPLELWLVRFLLANPEAGFDSVLAASAEARQEASRWLFSARHREAQEVRLRIVAEQMAFERLGAGWRRLGYPFGALVPSLATAIGSSADRPAALAELVGIVVNGGVRRPAVRIEDLHFARATPYETELVRAAQPGERVLPEAVAAVVRQALFGVVDQGTARRLRGIYRDAAGEPLAVGGKTGTGDHRYRLVGAGGVRLSERVVNRAATFVFFLGERHFGVITAFVPGAQAAGYEFTSSLPVQLLAELEPVLRPLVGGASATGVPRCTPPASPGAPAAPLWRRRLVH